MKKLTPRQREALEWLAVETWTAPWWAGRPHSGWPKQMPVQTYNGLSLAKLIKTRDGKWAEKVVSITKEGRDALRAERVA